MNRVIHRLGILGAVVLIATILQLPTTTYSAALRTVALSGQQAPGLPGGTIFTGIGPPALNDAGQTAFLATTDDAPGAAVGIWSEGSGSLALVVRSGDPAPGAPSGATFSDLFFSVLPVLNNAGETAFSARLDQSSGINPHNDTGIWSNRSGSLSVVVREGDQAAGAPNGESYVDFVADYPVFLNNSGQIAFSAGTQERTGIWSDRTGTLAPVALQFQQAIGAPNGVEYAGLLQFGDALSLKPFNDAGQTAFTTSLTDDSSGIWSDRSGSVMLDVRSGDPAPGTAGNVSFQGFSEVVLNYAGQIAFVGTLTGESVSEANNQGVWSEGSGSMSLVARRGDPAPGASGGAHFLAMQNVQLNNAGQTAFHGTLAGEGVNMTNNTGIWLESTSSLSLVARAGDHAPGTPSGVNFSGPFSVVLNDVGQVALAAALAGGGHGIWATDYTGALQLVARTGDVLEVAPGDFRTLTDLYFVPLNSAFNDIGQIAFSASFTDGSSGAFVSNAVAHLPGDFNNDGTVDAADYIIWRKTDETQVGYDAWRANFGRTLVTGSGLTITAAQPVSPAIPEPSATLILGLGAVGGLAVQRRFGRLPRALAAAIVACLFAAPQTTHAAGLRTVALSGQPAPGTPSGVSFGSFRFLSSNGVYFGPVLNDTGQVAFGGGLTGSGVDATNRIGIWSEGSGALALVARRGNQAPGAPDGATFNDFGNRDLANFLLFNNAGQTAFSATLAGSATGVGIWSEGSGSLAVVARSGQQAPGARDGATFSYSVLDFPRMPVLNNRGQVTFTAGADGCCRGMWSDRSGSLMPIALTGDPAPGLPSGVSFISFASPQAFFNDVGQTAFYASLTGDGVDSSNSRSIWSEGSGSLALVARAGDQAPGMPADVRYWNFQHPVMNNTGHVAFQAWVTSNTTGGQEAIFSSASSSVASIASLGQSAPGTLPGVTFYHFLNYPFPILNNAGHVAFRAELHGEGVQSGINNHGIWLERDGSVELVARTGDHAPGTPDGVTFGGFDLHWFYRHLPFLNDAGQIAFSAMLKGSGVDTGNDHGIWASDRTGELQLITRSGDQLEVAPGDFRTIADLDLGSSFIANQPRPSTSSSFNNLGQLAFWASFTDGSSGIFVSNRVAVPEPSAILLIAFGIAPVFVRWNRSR